MRVRFMKLFDSMRVTWMAALCASACAITFFPVNWTRLNHSEAIAFVGLTTVGLLLVACLARRKANNAIGLASIGCLFFSFGLSALYARSDFLKFPVVVFQEGRSFRTALNYHPGGGNFHAVLALADFSAGCRLHSSFEFPLGEKQLRFVGLIDDLYLDQTSKLPLLPDSVHALLRDRGVLPEPIALDAKVTVEFFVPPRPEHPSKACSVQIWKHEASGAYAALMYDGAWQIP